MLTSARLPVTNSVSAGDLVPVFVQDQGVTMAAAMSTIAAYIQTLLDPANYFENVYYTPTTGANITLPANDNNQWLVLTPIGSIVALTVIVPGQGIAIDGQEILITTTFGITSLNLSAANSTVVGASPGLTSETPQSFKYIQPLNIWQRV